jgi:hypothetical protein
MAVDIDHVRITPVKLIKIQSDPVIGAIDGPLAIIPARPKNVSTLGELKVSS